MGDNKSQLLGYTQAECKCRLPDRRTVQGSRKRKVSEVGKKSRAEKIIAYMEGKSHAGAHLILAGRKTVGGGKVTHRSTGASCSKNEGVNDRRN